ncbi:MAG: orc1/cdc6 family replication initiation protein [Candidatus Aenigmarchaeota archaeon]|nr:orc1/cdc6 family replication initiation protein [Candidatus Aenigmarchaeota archaeon]
MLPTTALPAVVRATEPLSDGFRPAALAGREEQAYELRGLVDAAARQPLHLWLHGPPGSGKTSLAQQALAQLEERHVRTAYVNCWGNQSFFAVLEAAFQELRALVQEKRELAYRIERLVRIAREGPLVIVLDEVDQMFPKERNVALYNLASLDHTSLVCVSQHRKAFHDLDPRVRSRLQPRFVECGPYGAPQLASLLRARAEAALAPDAWCEADLVRIAEASGGDARVAIQALRVAACLAERHRVPQVRPEDLQAALQHSQSVRKGYLLRTLSEHHRLLHAIVNEVPGISIRDLHRRYLQQVRQTGLEPMARRTFSHYKQFLVTARLLREEQAAGRRNERRLWVMDAP